MLAIIVMHLILMENGLNIQNNLIVKLIRTRLLNLLVNCQLELLMDLYRVIDILLLIISSMVFPIWALLMEVSISMFYILSSIKRNCFKLLFKDLLLYVTRCLPTQILVSTFLRKNYIKLEI
jgi:hypothetical protein